MSTSDPVQDGPKHRRSVARLVQPSVVRHNAIEIVIVCVISGLALAVRLTRIRQSYNLFLDEVSYADIGNSLASGKGTELYGQPFLLHPPMFFLEIAGVLRLSGFRGTVANMILTLRPIDAVFGSLDVALVVILLIRLSGLSAAAAGGLLLAMDPFLNRFDSRLLLEAPAMTCATAGVVLLTASPTSRKGAVAWGLVAGSFFALSATTKDLYVCVGAVPTLVLALVSHGAVRCLRLTAVISGTTGYVVYLATLIAGGEGRLWVQQKTVGVQRVLGIQQQTGFNKPGNPSLGSRLLANASTTSVSYALLAAGGLATLYLLTTLWRSRESRPSGGTAIVAVWCSSAIVLLSYEILFGTLEEQMFYPLLVTSTVALCHAITLAAARCGLSTVSRMRAGSARAVVVGIVAIALIADIASWTEIHTVRDDSYVRMLTWERSNLPNGAIVSATDDTSQFLLTGLRIGDWNTIAELLKNHVEYVVICTALVSQGYGLADRAFVRELDSRAKVVFSDSGRSVGELRVYDVRKLTATTTITRKRLSDPGRRSPIPTLQPRTPLPLFPQGRT